MNNFEKIQQVFVQILKVQANEVGPTSQRKDFVLWDSLSHLNLVMELEHQFKVNFNMDEIISIDSVQRIINLLDEKMKG